MNLIPKTFEITNRERIILSYALSKFRNRFDKLMIHGMEPVTKAELKKLEDKIDKLTLGDFPIICRNHDAETLLIQLVENNKK